MNIPNIPQNKFTNSIKPAAKFVGRGTLALAKKIIPGVIMMTCSFTLGHRMNSSRPKTIDPRMDAQWAYQAGQQRIKDSLRIVELEQRIAADSMKLYHLGEQLNLTKVAKKIK